MSWLNRLKKIETLPEPLQILPITPVLAVSKVSKAPATEPELMQIIRDSFHKNEQLRSDWSGFRKSLTVGRRELLVSLEKKIDAAYAAGDDKALQNALELHHNFHANVCKEFRR